MTGWFDPPRTVIALVAAGFAAIGAIAANADDGMAIWFIAAQVFAIEAIVAVAFALFRSGGSWSGRRRRYGGFVAVLATVAAPILAFVTMARAACGCGNAANGYMVPTIAGIQAHDWVFVAAFAFPLLMAIAVSGAPNRFRAGRPS